MLSELKFERRVRYEKLINTEDELLAFLKSTGNKKNYFYRGMSNSKYLCVTSFYRYYCEVFKPEIASVVYNQTENASEYLPVIDEIDFHKKSIQIINEFNKQLVNSGVVEKELSFGDACTLAQHYELPTNLIDFTFNPLIALFFASSGNDDIDAVIFESDIEKHARVINGLLQNGVSGYYKDPEKAHRELIQKLTSLDEEDHFQLKTPIIKESMLEHNLRIQRQSGVFVYNAMNRPYDVVMYNFWDEPYVCPGRTVYVVDSKLKPFARKLLADEDYSWERLMPDEDGIKIKEAVKITKEKLSIPERY